MVHKHAVTNIDFGDVVTHRTDNPDRLVAEDHRRLAFDVPVERVRAAQTTRLDTHDNFALIGLRDECCFDAHIAPAIQPRHAVHGSTATLMASRLRTRSKA